MSNSEEEPKDEGWFVNHYNTMHPSTKIKTAFVTVIVLFTLILFLYAAGYNANKHRIQDLQASRVASCQATYAAFIKVFAPFLPKDPESAKVPAAQQKRIDAFYAKINELVLGCQDQVKPNK